MRAGGADDVVVRIVATRLADGLGRGSGRAAHRLRSSTVSTQTLLTHTTMKEDRYASSSRNTRQE
jgi:hypothetical protein